MIYKWRKDDAHQKKRGRKVDSEYEAAVINKLLIIMLIDKKDGKMQEINIIANAAFSYRLFQRAAVETFKQEKFRNRPHLKNLQFSKKWVHGLIRRYNLKNKKKKKKKKRRRKTT